MLGDLPERPRRLRKNDLIRSLTSQTILSKDHLIQPYFVTAAPNVEEPITKFDGVFRYGYEKVLSQVEADLECGIRNFLIFGDAKPDQKNENGSFSLSENNATVLALKALKHHFGNSIQIFADVCLCPFTSHGHCGVIRDGRVDNDQSVKQLAETALLFAKAGADFVAPSDMMDGRVGAIRRLLDQQGCIDTGILSYSAKYASSYFGPFREALDSTPTFSDRSSYQMDFRDSRSALRECRLDIQEGADLIMVKPALAYLDIIQKITQEAQVPVVAYNVSGEYMAVKLLAQAGLADERRLVIENLSAMFRSGASAVITYHASSLARNRWV